MRNKTRVLLIVTIIIGISFFIMNISYSASSLEPQFVMKRCMEEKEINFSVWEDEKEDYVVFLPGFVELQDLTIHLNTDSPIYINDILLKEGLCCDIFEINQNYGVVFQQFGKTYTRNISFQQSGGVSTMFIETETGSMDYIHAQKGNEEKGQIFLFEESGNVNYTGDLESIKGRGNSTWDYYDKKPYSIKLEAEANLLGLGAAQRWILLANATDASNLRNKIVYDFAKEIGMAYSPESKWVDLYLNGEYVGLYLLCERNEIHTERVNIDENTGVLVSVEKEDRLIHQNYSYVCTDEKQALRIHNAPDDKSETYNKIIEKWQSIENAILAANSVDIISGMDLEELIDIDSWVKKYLIEEIFGNIDGCYLSQYFYYENNNKVYAGPVWDYDNSIGNQLIWQLKNPKTMCANRYYVREGYNAPWFYYLYQKKDFYNKIIYYYEVLFSHLLDELIEVRIDSYVSEIGEASELNRIRWFSEADDLTSEAKYIKEFLNERIVFLNSLWLEGDTHNWVKIDQSLGSFYAYYAVIPGECLKDLPDCTNVSGDKNFIGWYYCDTDEPFDPQQPIYENTEIYAKWEETASKKMKQIGKMIPLGVIFVMGMTLLITDIRRTKRNG